MAIKISVVKDGEEIESFETQTTDDFYFFRDSVNAALEKGEFGSLFPVFLKRFEPASWAPEEVVALREEVATISAALKKMPPKPFDGNWAGNLEMLKESGAPLPATLFEVYVDAAGRPILGEMLRLCDVALAQRLGMTME